MKIQCLKIGALSAALFGGQALAADMPVHAPPPAFVSDQWVMMIGVGPEVVNQFPGSKTYTVVPNGLITRWHPGEPTPFIAPDDGFSVAIIDYGGFKAGPVARYVSRRGLSDGNGNFFGLHNVGWTAELGGFAEFWVTQYFRTHLEVRQGVNGNHGLEANLALDGVYRAGPWTFSAGPRFAYGDNRFMNAYFSVTPGEAAVNGNVTPYFPSAGVDMIGGLLSARYEFNRQWSVTGFGGYNRLVGPAGSSPIPIRLGSRDEFTGGATIGYTFAWGGLGLGFLGL